ncbi:MAG: tetratricopeptide repeat protein [Promethearchaeota archaeon]
MTSSNNDKVKQLISSAKRLVAEYQQGDPDDTRPLEQLFGEVIPALTIEAVQYKSTGDLNTTLTIYMELLELTRMFGDQEGEAAILFSIGGLYFEWGRLQEALKQFQLTLQTAREVGDHETQFNTLMGIGRVYQVQRQLQQALDHFQLALQKAQEIGSRSMVALTLHYIGEVYFVWGRLSEALDHHQQALKIFQEVGDRQGEATSLGNIGEVYKAFGRFQEGLDHLQQALKIFQEVGDRENEGTGLNNIGRVYEVWGRLQEALDHYHQALKIAREMKNLSGEGTTLNNIGSVYEVWGRLSEALDHHQQALKIFQEVGDRNSEGKTLNHIGMVYQTWGRLSEALDHHQQALTIHREVGDRLGEAASLNNISLVYNLRGQLQEALDHFQQALTIHREQGDRQGEATILGNIGMVYQGLGQFQQALDHLRQALIIAREMGNRQAEGTTLNNLGLTYWSLERLPEALDHFQQGLKIHREMGHRRGESTFLNNIGRVYEVWGRLPEALDHLQQALTIHREMGDRPGEGATLNSIGSVHWALGRLQEALNYFQQALQIFREVNDRQNEFISMGNIGEVQGELDQFGEGFKNLQEALDIMEVMVGEMRSEVIRRGFRGTQLFMFNATVQLLLNWYMKGGEGWTSQTPLLFEALRFLELGKAREIVDKLTPGRPRKALLAICPKMREVIEEEQQLTERLQELDRIYAMESRAIAAVRTRGGDVVAAEKARLVSKTEVERLAKVLKARRLQILEQCADPGQVRQTATYNPLPTFKKTIFASYPNVLIWELFYYPEEAADLFTILAWSKESITLHKSNPLDLESAIARLREFYAAIARESLSEANGCLLELAQQLGQWLPETLWETLDDKELLILIPHGEFHMFPWSIAQHPSAAAKDSASAEEFGGYLGLKVPIVRSYSLSLVMSCLKREETMPPRLLLVANPNFNVSRLALPGADKEVDSILTEILPSLASPHQVIGELRHAKATEEAFCKAVEKAPSIIHFAGHGSFADDPWLSHLKFYAPKGHSPHTVTEMLNHIFPKSPLFILSACETARSELSKGDEAIGILRGLTLAGATTIVATNWLLDDQIAPLFMRYFYEHFLGKGQTAAQALLHARRELYEDRRIFEQPRFWAVYTLYGNPFKRVT